MDEPMMKTDINVMVAGQGGDGSLTIISVLSELLTQRGYNLFIARDVASRIKGGHAAAMLRGSLVWRSCMGDSIDLLLAFDREAVIKAAPLMAADGIIIFDGSDGSVDQSDFPETLRVFEIPFGRYAVRDLRRDIFKNSLSFGLLTRVFCIEKEQAIGCLRHVMRRLPDRVMEANLDAFALGLEFADDVGLSENGGPWRLNQAERNDHLLIGGNEALAFGFAVAGGRFFCGYPITPATEILEWLKKHLPDLGGVALQAEDELSAVNMAIGAAMTGVRTMTATSSPGFALMMEGISQSGAAEVPLVIVNSQRAGPSTGMPTKSEQTDIGMMVHGGNGEFPRIILVPGGPADCFDAGVRATNLAQKIQGPVIVAVDQAIAQDSRTVDCFDLDSVTIESGARIGVDELSQMDEYKRYAITDDGVSPWAVPGTPGGMTLMTGNERNEWGLVSTEPKNRKAMMDKRHRKIASVIDDLPLGRKWGDEGAEVGLLGIGMETGVVSEAIERLSDMGLSTKGLQPRTLWPVLDETFNFIASCRVVYVVEHSMQGQLRQLLMSQGVSDKKLVGFRRYDGLQTRVGELVSHISGRELNMQPASTAKIEHVA
jgi:2-oxoglutarate/2-oxoacid ferredoxin oxidoreductase subunit alpha